MTEPMDRRKFLKRSGLIIGVGAVAPTVLAACGDDEPAATTAAPATTQAPATTAAMEETPDTTAAMEETTTTAMMEEAPAEFDSITLAQVAGWISLDSNRTTGGALSTGQHTFEGLLIKLPDRSLIPGLATEMPRQVDDLTYRVKIRTDRTFTDGTPIKASDIVYGYDRLDPDRELGIPIHPVHHVHRVDRHRRRRRAADQPEPADARGCAVPAYFRHQGAIPKRLSRRWAAWTTRSRRLPRRVR